MVVAATNGTAGGWREMRADDLAAVSAIAAETHPDYPEDDAVFAERHTLFPEGCLIAEAEGRIVGYAFMHPCRLGRPPKLNALLGALPPDADCLHLHDVALSPAARGRGLGAAALEIARTVAERNGFDLLTLIYTPEAAAFWRRCGFVEIDAPSDVLALYGEGLGYMIRRIRP